MRWTTRYTIAVFGALAVVGAMGSSRTAAQQATPQAIDESITVTAESFCSDTKLRTTNARIHWSMPRATAESRGVANLASATQVIEATVYKNGFDKDLMVSLPVGQTALERPVAPQVRGTGRPPRAFQISLIQVERPRANVAGDAAPEMSAVVEGLEPGVTYTWRIAIAAAAGRIV